LRSICRPALLTVIRPDTAILTFALVVSTCLAAIGALCVVAPKRAILMFAQSSTLVTPDSASDRSTLLQFRIGGLGLPDRE